jgi:hypothetical protein
MEFPQKEKYDLCKIFISSINNKIKEFSWLYDSYKHKVTFYSAIKQKIPSRLRQAETFIISNPVSLTPPMESDSFD